jgi:hypothetical protein
VCASTIKEVAKEPGVAAKALGEVVGASGLHGMEEVKGAGGVVIVIVALSVRLANDGSQGGLLRVPQSQSL